MTCATARVRSAALAAAVAGALALTACDGGTTTATSGTSPRPAASTAPSAATASPAVTGGAAALEGSWITTAGGRVVALVVNGERAGLFSTDRTVCGGTAGTGDGARVIRLTCARGAGERTTGTVDAVNGTTLTVTWSGGPGRETYTKAEGGKLPSGFPTRLER